MYVKSTVFAAVLALPMSLCAQTRGVTLDQVASEADFILVGQVLSVDVDARNDSSLRTSRARIKALEEFKGPVVGEVVVPFHPDLSEEVSLKQGATYFLFLNPYQGFFRTSYNERGACPIENGKVWTGSFNGEEAWMEKSKMVERIRSPQ